ncbi:fimbrial-like protein [[Enterobacter] lignolyticus]|uniref:Fimbrial protein n=1 Tax=[Enterobacter] lignolyticus TaxID=1334193 RepID=A0A806X9Y0_9ENTR|nr:fimbrial-like protein [[Enterobacter] lignolyticus]ALR75489.1 fimbrial protein [[Enterobacter] lignolyticus]
MKSLFLSCVIGFLISSNVMAASTNINMTANIINTSCQIAVKDNGQIDVGTVDFEYLNNNTSVDQIYSGGSPFFITVSNCAQVSGKNPTRLTFSFTPVSGALSPTNQQVFANQSTGGASNVGIVILSIQDAQNVFNVLDINGQPRSIYSVNPDELINATYHFYARMQKASPTQSISSGLVKASVLVAVYYE